jgi:hypothetical protein
MRVRCVLLFVALLGYAAISAGEELDGSLHFTGGTNRNPNSTPAFSAGLHLDPALFSRIKSQFFDAGLSYDRIQGHSGVTADFRAKLAFFRCYGSEYQCEARKKFWLTAIPSVGKRWGEGGLAGTLRPNCKRYSICAMSWPAASSPSVYSISSLSILPCMAITPSCWN